FRPAVANAAAPSEAVAGRTSAHDDLRRARIRICRERPGGRMKLVPPCCPTPFKDGLGLVRAVKPCAWRRTAARLRGLPRVQPKPASIHVGNGVLWADAQHPAHR